MNVNKARLAQTVLGFGPDGGKLEKLTISYERHGHPDVRVEALFNPAEINLSKTAEWAQQHGWGPTDVTQAFRTVEAEKLTTELFFDTYESRQAPTGLRQAASVAKSAVTSVAPASLLGTRSAISVRRLTDRFAKLADVDQDLHRPPDCVLRWGRTFQFRGVLTSVEQRFTLFLEDGTPVRAILKCTFTEKSSTARARRREPHSADVHKTRQVRRNDSLHSLAAEEYGDPAQWRHIARANGIVNLRELRPGMVLLIPKLPS